MHHDEEFEAHQQTRILVMEQKRQQLSAYQMEAMDDGTRDEVAVRWIRCVVICWPKRILSFQQVGLNFKDELVNGANEDFYLPAEWMLQLKRLKWPRHYESRMFDMEFPYTEGLVEDSILKDYEPSLIVSDVLKPEKD